MCSEYLTCQLTLKKTGGEQVAEREESHAHRKDLDLDAQAFQNEDWINTFYVGHHHASCITWHYPWYTLLITITGGVFQRPVGKIVLYHTQVKSDFFAMMFERRKESGCAINVTLEFYSSATTSYPHNRLKVIALSRCGIHSFNYFTDNMVLPSLTHDIEIAVIVALQSLTFSGSSQLYSIDTREHWLKSQNIFVHDMGIARRTYPRKK
ncbi:hypothetical protein C8R48DRAFT_674319 [Suillus tomentosus]|nr:hypothetical protein C8R48DRAFT_674319 [Suillus tomentosus]